MEELITIMKKPGVKDCVRINNSQDIPDYLKEAVKVDEDKLVLDCLEGEQRVPLGSVIAYEKLESGKMNVWNKSNWKETTKEVDGIFYELPKPRKAVRVTDTLPGNIIEKLGDRLIISEDGTFKITTGNGVMECEPYNGYLVIYGTHDDGSLDVQFLTKGTPSFEQYFVLDDNGNMIQTLSEYDFQMTENDKKVM